MTMKLYTLNFSYVQVLHERLCRRVCEREYALACFMCPLSDRKNKTEQGIMDTWSLSYSSVTIRKFHAYKVKERTPSYLQPAVWRCL